MAVEILLNQGSLPTTDVGFEEKSNELVKIIIKKIDMLGSYLK